MINMHGLTLCCTGITDEADKPPELSSTPGYCLKLPGRNLNLTALLYAKKFRNHGYKSGALAAFDELEAEGLGKLELKQTKSAKVGPIYYSTVCLSGIHCTLYLQMYIC